MDIPNKGELNKDFFVNVFPFLSEKEKHEVYKRYSLQDFWNWWSRGSDAVMEISFPQLNYFSLKKFNVLNLPQNKSSLFVNCAEHISKLLFSGVLNHSNVYWGINPRREMFYTFGKEKTFTKKSFGIDNLGVNSINNILIDIDSHKEPGCNATPTAVQGAIKLAFDIIETFEHSKLQFKGFMMLCSANGIHLVLPLDEPIIMPTLEYEIIRGRVEYKKTQEYLYLEKVIKRSIAKELEQFQGKYNCAIDNTFDLRRVSRLPYSVNRKVTTDLRFCGILHINNFTNHRMKELILSTPMPKAIKQEKKFNKYTVKKEKLRDEPLVKLLLSQELPAGGRNHYLELSLAQLLWDSGISHTDPEVQVVLSEIATVQRKPNISVSPNYSAGKNGFSMETVNAYCWNNAIDFVYPILDDKPSKNITFFNLVKVKLNTTQPEILDIISHERFDYVNIKELVRLCKIEFKTGIWGAENTAMLYLYNNIPTDIFQRLKKSGLLKELLTKMY